MLREQKYTFILAYNRRGGFGDFTIEKKYFERKIEVIFSLDILKFIETSIANLFYLINQN